MSFYSGLAATATRLLTDKGQSMTMSKAGHAAYTPAAGAPAIGASTVTVVGIVKDAPVGPQLPGSLVRAGDRELMIAPTAPDPIDYDTVTVLGEVNSIIDSKVFAPGGVALYYKVIVRRGGGG